MRQIQSNSGFTLIELMVVVAILGILSSFVMRGVGQAVARTRDAKRFSDAQAIAFALRQYYVDKQSYPPVHAQSAGWGGWNVSYKPDFLSELAPYLSKIPSDPLNNAGSGIDFTTPGGRYYYAYYNYPDGYGASKNCDSSTFAVLAVVQFESIFPPNTPTPSRHSYKLPVATCGNVPIGNCPGGGIGGTCRDWSTEFDYSILLAPDTYGS